MKSVLSTTENRQNSGSDINGGLILAIKRYRVRGRECQRRRYRMIGDIFTVLNFFILLIICVYVGRIKLQLWNILRELKKE